MHESESTLRKTAGAFALVAMGALTLWAGITTPQGVRAAPVALSPR